MKGLVKVSPSGLINLVNKCRKVILDFDRTPYIKIEKRWSWRKLRKIDVEILYCPPHWYGYKSSLHRHFDSLLDNALNAQGSEDEIWLSELSYTHLFKLSNSDHDANPIYIMDY